MNGVYYVVHKCLKIYIGLYDIRIRYGLGSNRLVRYQQFSTIKCLTDDGRLAIKSIGIHLPEKCILTRYDLDF